MARRKAQLTGALNAMSDEAFWNTGAADTTRAPTAEIVGRSSDGVGSAPAPDRAASVAERSRAVAAQAPAPKMASDSTAAVELLALRSRGSGRQQPTGRIAVRVPAAALRWFNATARLRGVAKSTLFEQMLRGFVERVEREGAAFLVDLQRELSIGAKLTVTGDLWDDDTPDPALTRDRGHQAMSIVQIAHPVVLELKQRFDDCAWRLDLPKDTVGRLAVLGFLHRFACNHRTREADLGYAPDDVQRVAGTYLD